MIRVTKLIAFLLIITVPAFSQQYLWSTAKLNNMKGEFEKNVPLENVTSEVLKLYDVYRLYYDLSGYSKEEFMKKPMYGFDKLDWLKEIQEQTVFAIRGNSGEGSYVLVMCVSKLNVNAIIFTNSTMKGSGNMALTLDSGKFERWFKTLLN